LAFPDALSKTAQALTCTGQHHRFIAALKLPDRSTDETANDHRTRMA
jgi:hypothetical protein